MKLSKLLIIGLTCTTLAACDLTEYPYTSITDEELTNNPNSVEAVTLGNYSALKRLEFNKGVHQIGEYGSDNVSMSGQSTSHTFNLYNYQRITNNSYCSYLWGICYKTIVNCNKIISTSEEGSSKELDHLIGENYFIRALLYHQLAITFGRPYHVASDTDLAVPLKLTNNLDEYPPRATVKAVYEQVIKDLLKAEQLMEGSGIEKNACYGNQWVVKGMLSRVYLYMHDYENAEKYATDVIEHSDKRLLTSTEYVTMNELVPESNPEAMFAIRMIKDDLNTLGAYSVIGSQYAVIDGQGYGEVYASLPLIQALKRYPSDIRMSFISPQYEDPDEEKGQLYELMFVGENYFYGNSLEPTRDPLHRTYYRFQNVEKVDDTHYKVIVDPNSDPFELKETLITVDADGYADNVEARQIYRKDGQTAKAEWVTYRMHAQKKMRKRNDYPRFYILKCQGQEKFGQLWSPMVMRLSEMYLNRAEARYYLGNAEAVADLNIIKQRALVPDYSEQSDGELLDAILDERRKELFAEAQRKYDLLRNDKVIDRHYPGCHDRGAESAVVQEIHSTDDCAVLYIPQGEIDSYPIDLPQNP